MLAPAERSQTMPSNPNVGVAVEAVAVATLPKPTARWLDKVRVVGAAVGALCRALVRRLLGHKVYPTWSTKLELLVAATRGSWSVMPAIGMVRWRNVGESMSPLLTNGLTADTAVSAPEAIRPRTPMPLHCARRARLSLSPARLVQIVSLGY